MQIETVTDSPQVSAENYTSLPFHIDLTRALLSDQCGQDMLPAADNIEAWQTLLQRGYAERMVGFYHHHLQQQGVAMPLAIAHQMKRKYLEQWRENGILLREIGRIRERLDSADIPHLFYKGPLFAQQIYNNLGCRATSDIDIMLLDSQQIQPAAEILGTLDYKRQSQIVAPLSITTRCVYEFEYAHPDFSLDLHWTLQQHPSLNLDMQAVWNTRQEVAVLGAKMMTFSAEYTFLAYALALAPDISNNGLKLRWFLELFLLLCQMKETTDWSAFWQRRAQENTTRVTQVVIYAVQQIFCEDGVEVINTTEFSAEIKRLGQQVLTCLHQPTSELQRKRLAFALYDAPELVSAGWWLLTLPIRTVTHPTVTKGWFRPN